MKRLGLIFLLAFVVMAPSWNFQPGSSAWSPSTPGSLYSWFNMQNSGSITQSGGTVSQWNDLSSNSNNAIQATSTAQLVYNATAINGHPGLENTVASSGHYMVVTNTLAPTPPYTICIVGVDYGSSETTVIGSTLNGGTYFAWPYFGNHLGGDHNSFEFYDGGSADAAFNASVGASNTPWSLCTAISSVSPLAFSAIYVNGTNYSSSLPSTYGNASTLKLAAAKYIGGGPTNSYVTWKGAIGEIAIWTKGLSTTDMANWHTYESAEWGTP